MYHALQTVSLNLYLDSNFAPMDIMEDKNQHIRWHKANTFVTSVLMTSMEEDIQAQTVDIWAEARHLYLGTTATDWTLIITALATTRFTDGKDIATQIAKMKSYGRDLVLMQRNVNNELPISQQVRKGS
ncbi:hypothetical protein OG21DRAFT_1568786 [Imleria badia]|nr:hypothetical protein OG21DRAFT_1568786 [Imleria badia]